MREFYVAKGWEDKNINLPYRTTTKSAGYDFEAAEKVIIPGLLGRFNNLLDGLLNLNLETSFLKPTLIPTGIKVRMQDDEVLHLYNRSGNPLKRLLLLATGVSVIDSDYFENIDNDGHIYFLFWNLGIADVVIEKGERIGQGIFNKFLLTRETNDKRTKTREGGFGHSGK